MKKRNTLALSGCLLSVLCVVLVLSACAKPASPATIPSKLTPSPSVAPVASPTPKPAPSPVAAVPLPWEKWPVTQIPASWGWPEFFVTNGVTSLYPEAVAMAEVVKKYSPIKTQVVQIGSGIKGIGAVIKGDALFNIVDAFVLNAAFLGVSDFAGQKPGSVRGVATPNRGIQIGMYIRNGSGIKTPSDLKGKKIAFAENIPVWRITTEAILKGYGMTWNDVKKVPYTASGELQNLMRQNLVDMYVYNLAPNTAMTTEMTTTGDAYLLGIDADKIGAVEAATGGLYPKALLLANSFKGQDKELITLSMLNSMHIKADVPESMVYTVIRILMEHEDEFRAMGASVSKDYLDIKGATTPAYMLAAFHAGAIRYYKEKGVWGAEQDKAQQKYEQALKDALAAWQKAQKQ